MPNLKAVKPARMTQTERTAMSDARMYEAAIALIAEIGTHNTTLKDIGIRAGYSRGLASNRFGSKEALFGSLVTDFNRRWAAELDRYVGGRTGLSAFLAALDAVEDFLVNRSTQMRAMYILWYESISGQSEVHERLAEHHEAYRRDAEKWVREGIAEGFIRPTTHPKQTAVQFCSFILGTIYQWLVSPDAFDLHATFHEYRRITVETIGEKRRIVQPDRSTF